MDARGGGKGSHPDGTSRRGGDACRDQARVWILSWCIVDSESWTSCTSFFERAEHSGGGQIVRRRKLAVALVYLTLELGALIGVPVRLDQIEEMARLLNRTLATEVQRRNDDGDPPPKSDGE